MIENIEWLGHASFKIKGEKTIYIDPWKLADGGEADVILVSHSHYDHLSVEDVQKLQKDQTVIVASSDCKEKLSGDVRVLTPGSTIEVEGIEIEAVPSYNENKDFHPKGNNWLGFVITIGEKKLYYAGDTDATAEMKDLKDIDVALLPVGGTYTMTAEEAAQAANIFSPKIAVPYHWGDIVGSQDDAEKFKSLFKGDTKILKITK